MSAGWLRDCYVAYPGDPRHPQVDLRKGGLEHWSCFCPLSCCLFHPQQGRRKAHPPLSTCLPARNELFPFTAASFIIVLTLFLSHRKVGGDGAKQQCDLPSPSWGGCAGPILPQTGCFVKYSQTGIVRT